MTCDTLYTNLGNKQVNNFVQLKIKDMKKLILSLIAVLFIISACSDSSSPSETNEILPLKVGNEWWFKNTPYKGDDSLTMFNIIRKAKYFDEDWFVFNLSGKQTLMKNKADGLWAIEFSEEFPDGKEFVYFKYPAEIGTITYTESQEQKLISINEKVEVPAGVFNCYLYRSIYKDEGMSDIYLSPGTGFVKMIFYKDSVNIIQTRELINYTLK